MNWVSYEETVKNIYEQLGMEKSVEILCWGRNCKVTGKSGVNHQVDLLARHDDGIHTYTTAVECKFWEDKVDKEPVTKLSEIIEDAQIEKGIIVSKSGFTSDAVQFAKYRNISLVELRKPVDKDWEGRIRNINIRMRMHYPEVYNYQLIQDEPKEDSRTIPVNLPSDMIFVHEPDGSISTFHDLISRALASDDMTNIAEGEEIEHTILLETGSELSFHDIEGRASLKEISFKVRYYTIEDHVEIRGEDYVSLIISLVQISSPPHPGPKAA